MRYGTSSSLRSPGGLGKNRKSESICRERLHCRRVGWLAGQRRISRSKADARLGAWVVQVTRCCAVWPYALRTWIDLGQVNDTEVAWWEERKGVGDAGRRKTQRRVAGCRGLKWCTSWLLRKQEIESRSSVVDTYRLQPLHCIFTDMHATRLLHLHMA